MSSSRTFDFQVDKENKKIILKRKVGANWIDIDITDEIIQVVSEYLFLEAEEGADTIAVKFKKGGSGEK